MGLATCWLYSQTQGISMFLSEMKGQGGESKIVGLVFLTSVPPDPLLIPHLPGSPTPSPSHCEQLLASRPDGPPCQLSDVTHQSPIFAADLY